MTLGKAPGSHDRIVEYREEPCAEEGSAGSPTRAGSIKCVVAFLGAYSCQPRLWGIGDEGSAQRTGFSGARHHKYESA